MVQTFISANGIMNYMAVMFSRRNGMRLILAFSGRKFKIFHPISGPAA
jgi:hypothetical protein